MKAHLTSSDDPLPEGQDYIALCRKTVKRAKWIAWWDTAMMANWREVFNAVTTCRKCLLAEAHGSRVYAMVSGGEVETPAE